MCLFTLDLCINSTIEKKLTIDISHLRLKSPVETVNEEKRNYLSEGVRLHFCVNETQENL